MKKILYIITRMEENNGPNRVLRNMLTGINQKKYKLYVLSLFDKESYIKNSNVDYIGLGFSNVLDIFIKGKKEIKKIEREISPDVTHSHGLLPDYINTFFKKAKRVNTLHCNFFEDYKLSHNAVKASLMTKLHLYSLKRIDNVVCCSESVYDKIKKIKNINLVYIENGIRDEKIEMKNDIRKQLHIKDDDVVYIYSGSLSKGKNVLLLVKLFLKNIKDNEHLLLLGDGKLKDKIENASCDKSNIHVLGYRKCVNEYLFASDVYVSASLTEGLPISVIDALSNGLLILLSDIRSHKEFFNKDNTYLGECFTEDNFKVKLDRIRNNVSSIDKRSIIEYKNKYFSDKTMMKKYEVLYEDTE